MPTFMLKISAEMHSRVRRSAFGRGKFVKTWLMEAVEAKLAKEPPDRTLEEAKLAEPEIECPGRRAIDREKPEGQQWSGGQPDAPHCFQEQKCRVDDPLCDAMLGYMIDRRTGKRIDYNKHRIVRRKFIASD